MADSAFLLRMLEPVVRPVPTTGPAADPRRLPLEQQSFESLLARAQAADESAHAADAGDASSLAKPGPLGPLAEVDAIQNASLRTLLQQIRATASTAQPPSEPGLNESQEKQ